MKAEKSIRPIDGNDAQARLSAMPGSIDNVFTENTWEFEWPDGRSTVLDFNDLHNMSERHPDWQLAVTVDWVDLTKRMWIYLDSVKGLNTYWKTLTGLKIFWTAMAQLNINQLTRDNCDSTLRFLLMHHLDKNTICKRLNLKSYKGFHNQIQLQSYKLALSKLGLDWISSELTESVTRKILRKLIPELTDDALTYRDWSRGGSFNMLTLDYGQYYVEHCLTYFEKNYPLAMALESTLRAIPEIAESLGYSKATVDLYASKLLHGYSPEVISRRHRQWSITTIRNVNEALTQYFGSTYSKYLFEAALLKENNLTRFVSGCGLQISPENIDRIRVILWDWIRRNNKTETLTLLKECQKPVSWALFQKQLTSIKNFYDQKSFRMPTIQDYEAIGLTEEDFSCGNVLCPILVRRSVAQAGLTSVVALTGWRKSEFGFSHSAINRSKNRDRLDQYAFPWRYQVDWYVYKTHGKVRLRREITFNILIIAERLQSLHDATDNQPCLFSSVRRKTCSTDSRSIVTSAVTHLWRDFVKNYPKFNLLDDWTMWHALQLKRDTGNSLDYEDQKTQERLIAQKPAEEWNELSIDINLKEAWQRARNDWPILELFFTSTSTKDKTEWIVKYRNQNLRPDWQALLDDKLSSRTKDWLHSLPTSDLTSNNTTRTVTNSLLEDTLYPTPHAFRHMWAEAVYRRFDGDAGWMIRSQFKHVSRGMWLAYVRDKDNRLGHKIAKEQVISSLVRNYIKHQGAGYTGQLHTWLRRILKRTSVVSPEEQEQLAEHLTTKEIEDIKANPWGYCILMYRTRHKAKCAEMGEPMRHNAAPDLCSGCMHNLMQNENVEWTLFHAATHVAVLKNPIVPLIFKKPSYDLVKNITKHVRSLYPKHDALVELNEALDNYKTSKV